MRYCFSPGLDQFFPLDLFRYPTSAKIPLNRSNCTCQAGKIRKFQKILRVFADFSWFSRKFSGFSTISSTTYVIFRTAKSLFFTGVNTTVEFRKVLRCKWVMKNRVFSRRFHRKLRKSFWICRRFCRCFTAFSRGAFNSSILIEV